MSSQLYITTKQTNQKEENKLLANICFALWHLGNLLTEWENEIFLIATSFSLFSYY